MSKRFIEFCRTTGIFEGRSHVLAAVSGGADSIVLMNLLNEYSNALGINTTVAHVNHMIRPAAGNDLDFVSRSACTVGLEFLSVTVNVPDLAQKTGDSLETAGRKARYKALFDLAGQAGCDCIATGHSMTDQAETVLMRMIRGTGPLGLSGVSIKTDDGIVRPLLCMTATEIRELASSRKWDHVKDETNDDETFLRNRIRAVLLPVLMKFNPKIESGLAGLAADAASLSVLVESLAESLVSKESDGSVMIRRDSDIPEPLAGYAVRHAFRKVTGEPLGLSRTHIEAAASLLTSFNGPAQIHLPRRTVVFSRPEGILFIRDLDGPPPGSARRKTDRVD